MASKNFSITIPQFFYDQYLNKPEIDNRSQFLLQYFLKGMELSESDTETTKSRNIALTIELQKVYTENKNLKTQIEMHKASRIEKASISEDFKKVESIRRAGLMALRKRRD